MTSQGADTGVRRLVIVESPAKARTIQNYLGRGYTVKSSVGHIRDLPQRAADVPAKYKGTDWAKTGVDIGNEFAPLYVVSSDKKDRVRELKQAMAEVDELLLATDEDREGEAIAWHLIQVLKPKIPYRRMVFNEITEEAIQAAYDTYVADTGSRETVTASHILVETEEEAKAIIDQLKDGADFAELAREKSTGPSGPGGGSLGSFGRGQMVPTFEAAAFGMRVDSFSDNPVQTQFGWHVIQVSDKGIQEAPALDQMRDQIAANLSRQSFARIVETLRVGTTIEIRPLADVMAEARQAAENAQ